MNFTAREFNQDVGRAKRVARQEPVFVTDRGRPSHVLLTFEMYRQITGKMDSIVDLLAIEEVSEQPAPHWQEMGPR